MDKVSWMESVASSLQAMTVIALEWLPQLAAATAVMLIGWLLAYLLRRLSIKLADKFDYLWHRLGQTRGLETLQDRRPPTYIIASLLYWLVLIFFAAVAAKILKLEFIANLVEAGLGYLPIIFAAVFIIAFGVFLGGLCRQLIVSAMASAGMAQAHFFGRVAQVSIIILTLMLGLAQLGLDVSFLTMVFAVSLAGLLAAIALAFGMGARGYVADVLSAQHVRQRYQPGDIIKILDVQGKLLSISSTLVILDCDEGQVTLPASLFSQHVSTLIEEVEDDDA